jgi:hypothetical protein
MPGLLGVLFSRRSGNLLGYKACFETPNRIRFWELAIAFDVGHKSQRRGQFSWRRAGLAAV